MTAINVRQFRGQYILTDQLSNSKSRETVITKYVSIYLFEV